MVGKYPSIFEFNGVLIKAGLDPQQVMVMRHRPTESELRQALPWLGEENPALYKAYQSNHGPVADKALARARIWPNSSVACLGREFLFD